jgi:hypothetical protein
MSAGSTLASWAVASPIISNCRSTPDRSRSSTSLAASFCAVNEAVQSLRRALDVEEVFSGLKPHTGAGSRRVKKLTRRLQALTEIWILDGALDDQVCVGGGQEEPEKAYGHGIEGNRIAASRGCN